MAAILPRGIYGKQLKFTYDLRNNADMIRDLGFTIADICKNVKGGILVFFPSYSLMT